MKDLLNPDCRQWKNREKGSKVIIFLRSRDRATELHKVLLSNNLNAALLHGRQRQDNREETMRRFRTGEDSIMVCTSVAARGLDVSNVELVVNFDLPPDIQTYTHR
jgi:superfamily II DNA/RNA helicase